MRFLERCACIIFCSCGFAAGLCAVALLVMGPGDHDRQTREWLLSVTAWGGVMGMSLAFWIDTWMTKSKDGPKP